MKTKILEMDKKTEIPQAMWDQGLVCGITRLSLQQCKLAEVPAPVIKLRCTLKELELGQNILKELPGAIGKMVKLTKLTLNSNQISALPTEMGCVLWAGIGTATGVGLYELWGPKFEK